MERMKAKGSVHDLKYSTYSSSLKMQDHLHLISSKSDIKQEKNKIQYYKKR